MRWAVVLCLATPFAILVCGHRLHGARSCRPAQQWWRARLLEVLYAFTMRRQQRLGVCRHELQHSRINVMLGLEMLFARFMPIIGTLVIAGSLAKKGKVAESAGTLSTTNGMFVFLLVFIVLLIGALSFFPALALGPVAEFFQMIA
ncbi:MAG: potassium-transporting ATPase subunit KdpA [Collinsella sp.]